MHTISEEAWRGGCAMGALPVSRDRANFGRLELDMPLEALAASVCEQVQALAEIAATCGARLAHVKPHGALYNQAVKNRGLAAAIAEGVAKAVGVDPLKNNVDCHPKRSEGSALRPSTNEGWSKRAVLVGLAGSPMLDAFHQAG